ncbi:MAG: PIN domain-containing protein [Chloroflexi bacterium]|nr:PIN domain-containing protein [Chloroflexota bacterium]
MILVDTSGLIANYDRRDRHHAAVARILAQPQRRILSPFVLAELDYLIAEIAGQQGELVVLEDVARGAYRLEPFGAADVAAARVVIERYADLRLGLADASIVVLAERYQCHDVLTLDQRHFRAVAGPGGKPFRLLPHDATP